MDETLVKWQENSCFLKLLTTGSVVTWVIGPLVLGTNFAAVWPVVASMTTTVHQCDLNITLKVDVRAQM